MRKTGSILLKLREAILVDADSLGGSTSDFPSDIANLEGKLDFVLVLTSAGFSTVDCSGRLTWKFLREDEIDDTSLNNDFFKLLVPLCCFLVSKADTFLAPSSGEQLSPVPIPLSSLIWKGEYCLSCNLELFLWDDLSRPVLESSGWCWLTDCTKATPFGSVGFELLESGFVKHSEKCASVLFMTEVIEHGSQGVSHWTSLRLTIPDWPFRFECWLQFVAPTQTEIDAQGVSHWTSLRLTIPDWPFRFECWLQFVESTLTEILVIGSPSNTELWELSPQTTPCNR